MSDVLQPNATASATIRLPVVALRNMVIFPGIMQPIEVGRAKSLVVAARANDDEYKRIALVTQKTPDVDDPKAEDLYSICVEAEVLRVVKAGTQRATIVVRGIRRLELQNLQPTEDELWGEFVVVDEVGETEVESQGLALAVRDQAKQLIAVSPDIPDETAAIFDQVREPGRLADVAAAHIDAPVADKIELLSQLSIPKRLEEILTRLQRALETFRVREHIDSHVRAEMGRHQREAMLRQRMRAIQDELGDADDEDAAADFEERLKAITMPADVEEVTRKQIARLRQIPPQSPEYTVTRTYIEWLVELPWSTLTEDSLDLENAKKVLDEDHYGLEKVKKRIIEYLAIRKLKPDKKGPILCLVGPPGVGKTSTGRSIARALNRKFVRASLGGVRDEAEIRGHRRTYVGALPGRVIQSLKRAGTRNPIFVLDEIDKLGNDFRGDPASALLEVLDPEQNATFSDHFLEVPFDLSQVMFFATANEIDPIPPALKDRLEILEIPGYTRAEKLHIARQHLLPKQISEHGLSNEQANISDEAIMHVIDAYTREAGVRNLERELASVCRAIAVKIASEEKALGPIDVAMIGEILGPIHYYPETAERTEIPGVATGLAWTPVGGEVMFIEAALMKGSGKLILTGQLGDVMQESAIAALTVARARAEQMGADVSVLPDSDVHIHVPGGAVKKDGPSAGITIVSALVSLLTGRRVLGDVAMTGEISLRGSVMPVGGVKEKVLAAHRAGIKRIVLSERNKKDLVDIPDDIQHEVELVFVSEIQQVLDIVLEPAPKKPASRRSHNPVPSTATPPPAF